VMEVSALHVTPFSAGTGGQHASHGRILFLDLDAGGEYVGDFVLTIPRLALKHDWCVKRTCNHASGQWWMGVVDDMVVVWVCRQGGRVDWGRSRSQHAPVVV